MAVPPPPTFEEFGDNIFAAPPAKPTLGQRGAAADVKKTEGEVEKLYATLPAVKEKADADAAVALYNAQNVGWQEANKDFQKQYVAWRNGNAADFFDKIQQLRGAVNLLKSGQKLSGPVFSRLPAFIRETVNPESVDVRADVEKVIQASLRETLGAQFTEKEGTQLLARTYNPALPETMIAANVEAELNKILAIAKSREAMSRYYEENSTLKGYKPEDWLPVVEADFAPTRGLSGQEKRAAEAAAYRDSVNNIGGEPLKGFRFRPGEEQQIIDYANSPEFTPEGYANLVASLYKNAAGVAPDMDALRAEAEKIAERPVGQRAGSVDYSQVDLAAMGAAGIDEKFIQALKNAPTSVVKLGMDLLSPVTDAVKSTLMGERTGVYKAIPDLVADIAAKAGLGETDQETLNALGGVIEDRYGGMDAIQNTLVTDPAGLVADLSMILTMGGSAAAKAPGVLGSTGRKVAQVGQAIDPISFTGNMLSKATPDDLANFARRAPAESVALTTGAPPSAFREAFDIGAERQRMGVTPRTEAFREGLAGNVDPATLVVDAKGAMQGVRDAAGQEYRSGMLDISKDKSVLAFDDIDNALQKMRADAMFNGQVVDSSSLAAVERMQPVVDQWRALDPATFHTPEGMDKLKQRIFDEVGTIPDDQRTVRRAAGTVYNAVKDTIKNQAPAYAGVMEKYADASEVLGRMERELGLGRKGSIDTAASKLTERPPSRKGRDDLVSLLAEYDPRVGAEIAGEQLSRYFPRGLRGAGTGLGVAGGSVAGSFTNPLALLGASTISPHLMGEAAYGLGRASVPVSDAFSAVGRSPGTLLGTQRGLALAGQTDEELERLAYPYMTVPPAGDGMGVETGTPAEGQQPAAMRPAPPAEAGFTNVDVAGNEVAPPEQTTRVINGRITDIDPVTQQRVYLDTNEPVEPDAMKLGGMVRKYQAGGAVKGYREGGRKKQTSWYDDMLMAASRRGNDLAAAAADLVDKYGITPADAVAWVAENVEGRSPQEVARIRQNLQPLGSNRAVVEAGAASNERRFREAGGRGARSAEQVTPPVRLSAATYRPQDVPRAVISETPKMASAVADYFAKSTPSGLLRDAQQGITSGVEAFANDPYGMVFDTMLYAAPQTALAAAPFDYAGMRESSKMLADVARDPYVDEGTRADLRNTQRMVDALGVLPLAAPLAPAAAMRKAPRRKKTGGLAVKRKAK
jgi:hypothetical protein